MARLDEFELTESVTQDDIPAMVSMTLDGFDEDPVWHGMMRNVSRDDAYNLLARIHESRVGKPQTQYFKIVHKVTGELVAWTALLGPQTQDVAEQTHKQILNMRTPNIPGIDARLARIFFESGSTIHCGYDAAKHFHRKGTFVHAGYQRRGLGTWLSQHCSTIADVAGCATFLSARPSSKSLFKRDGFEIVKELEIDVKGDGAEMYIKYVMRRDPQATVAESSA